MPQREVELILVRQLASYLTTPFLVVDTKGTLLFFNEAAEPLLGRRFEETDELPLDEWSRLLDPSGLDGHPLAPHERPLMIALEQGRPASGPLRLRGLTGELTEVDATAFPLRGQGGRELGAVALLWPRS